MPANGVRAFPCVEYNRVHERLRKERGPAREHDCASCGKPACQWAYQYTGQVQVCPFTGREYSDDPSDYSPMCRSCHVTFDMDRLPDWRQASSDRLKKFNQTPEGIEQRRQNLERVHSDARLVAERNRRLREIHAKPEFDSIRLAALWDYNHSERGREIRREAMRKRHASGLEIERNRRVMTAVNRRKYICLQCAMVSTPGGIGRHQSLSGHEGVV